MELLLVRHAKAEERTAYVHAGGNDNLRPLTAQGVKQMRQAVRGLRGSLQHIELLATSPLLRAQQTAQLMAQEYGGEIVRLEELAPGRPPLALLSWLQHQRGRGVVALVGHEPDLGVFASWLLAGTAQSFMPLKKGGACLIRFEGALKEGHGLLAWVLEPAQLRAMRR